MCPLVLLTVLLFIDLLFLKYFEGRFFPGVEVAGVPLGGLSPASAYQKLAPLARNRTTSYLTLNYRGKNYVLDLTQAEPQIDLEQKISEAYLLGRSDRFPTDLYYQVKTLGQGLNFPLEVSYRRQALLDTQIKQINQLIKRVAVNARLIPNDTVTIIPAQNGEEVNEKALREEIANYLTLKSLAPRIIPTRVVKPEFSTADAKQAEKALGDVKSDPIRLHFGKELWTIDQTVLFPLLNLNQTEPVLAKAEVGDQTVVIEEISVGRSQISDNQILLDKNTLTAYLKSISDKIDQPTQEAKFNFDPNTKRASEFRPSQEGRKLDIDQTAELISQALTSNIPKDKDINLPVKVTRPQITTASINNFGIQELLGEGVSHFAGSIDNRIYNIGLAAFRINGTLVAPRETFSFNATVGDISGASGYKPAYVIKSGRTVLDDGGGVCQVSTTLFRAVLNSGLPVIERTAHAYRVGYYEQGFPPGLDATVFSPTVDFKFKNDSPAYILIQASVGGASLYIDIYGTGDGRVATLSKPVITNQTPPPPELRQDDPTLPKGTVKQVDWSAWGANVSFYRTVTRGSETLISETWKSFFKPWQAIFLVGTQ